MDAAFRRMSGGTTWPLSCRESERGRVSEYVCARHSEREAERVSVCVRERERERERERDSERKREREIEREREERFGSAECRAEPPVRFSVQGYLAHKKTPPPEGPP